MRMPTEPNRTVTRRSVLAGAFASLGWALARAEAAAAEKAGKDAPVARKDPLKITKLETFLIKPRWLFLKVHTNAGIVGLGEPVLEGRALTCAEAVKEIEPYLIGKDPRQVVHHWQAIYRHAFYRGGPILTSALSGIDQALWDIKGKALGVPVYELLGGPTRNRVRVYAHARSPQRIKAGIARGTHLPIATGERVFTKWGFREVLEKKAATVLQPDLCHAGGITECRLIAGMAEAYYAAIAPHNPLGPISLAAGVQLAASIPNFLCQEQVSLGEGILKKPFTLRDGYLDLPTGPGLGIELDENALADKIGHDWKNPQSYDAHDGSVVDW